MKTKKIILIGIIITFAFNNIIAQKNVSNIYVYKKKQKDLNIDNVKRKPFKFGAKLGLNFATTPTFLKIDTDFNETKDVRSNTKILFSFYFGFISEYNFNNESLKLQTEFLYSRNGTRHSSTTSPIYYNVKVDEFLIPIIMKYKITDIKSKPLSINGGVFMGYIFKVIGQDFYEDAPKYNMSNQYNSFDTGFILGIEYSINNNIKINSRFNYGLMNIVKNTDATNQIGTELSSYNRFFHIGINYML